MLTTNDTNVYETFEDLEKQEEFKGKEELKRQAEQEEIKGIEQHIDSINKSVNYTAYGGPATVDQFDAALARYYKLMGADYSNEFSEYCEENGFDDLEEEMGADHNDCMLVDFDDDILFKQEPKDKTKAIFDLLMKIYLNPDCDFQEFDNEYKPLQIKKEDFKINTEDIREIKLIYSKQLVTIFNGEMKDDRNITTILAISEKRQVPYLLYLTDMFSRDRISAEIIDGKNLQPSDWVAINKHCIGLKKLISTKAKDIVQHAITTFHRIIPRLMLSATTQIMDDLEITAKYISTQVDFVYSLAQKGNKACPFQLDALIAYNNATLIEIIDNIATLIDDEKYEKYDVFGNVKNKLKTENLLHEIGIVDDEEKDNDGSSGVSTIRQVREYKMTFDKFKQEEIKKKYKGSELEEYPRNHRFCSFIDRRKPSKINGAIKNEIIFFEPPNDCNTIPDNVRALWYFDSSKTTIIPNIGYCKNLNEKNKKGNNNMDNINSGNGAKGALVFISFHVTSVNTIRAYLYLNGQVTRFFPSDIIDILPRYFDPNEKNKTFIQSQAAKDLIAHMKPKLRDLQFEAFYNEFKYKKKYYHTRYIVIS